ncbi:hypothetical protein SEUCBS140593_003196 [Sporothrix eucalyptigena]|uniref:F-box domain-containing protein n=1 Tax=Sporothrix eucalyptigena TaxID=1812306 RepID=A0ABP0BCW2_9PEZI
MVLFTDLPLEVGTAILSYVTPRDLVSASLANRGMYSYIKGNSQVHRHVYCNYFDKPPATDVDWEQEIHDFRRLRNICHNKDKSKEDEFDFFSSKVKGYLGVAPETVAPGFNLSTRTYRNEGHLERLINGRSNYDAFFTRSFLYDRMRRPKSQLPFPDKPLALHQASAQLHCLLGAVVLKHVVNERKVVHSYPYAVSKVYDMREYSRASLWGPFMSDGSGNVDWEKVEAIMLVLRYNLIRKDFMRFKVIHTYWNSKFLGSSPGSYRPLIRNMEDLPDDTVELDNEDPYGVTGTWLRLVSFLDYSDFFRFNFPDEEDVPDNMPRKPFNAEEELRMIVMKIHVTRIERPGERDEEQSENVGPTTVDDGPYDNTHPDFPIVHFQGKSNSMDNPWDDNANSGLRGTVRTTKEGHIRWTTFSTFDGHPRWRSEGIQIGGRRSGRGVIGNWFDANYDRQGPCGPTAFWKVHAKKKSSPAVAILGDRIESYAYLLTDNEESFDSLRSDHPPWLMATTAAAATAAVVAARLHAFASGSNVGEAGEASGSGSASGSNEASAKEAPTSSGSGAGLDSNTRGYDYGDDATDDEDDVFQGIKDDEDEERRLRAYMPQRIHNDERLFAHYHLPTSSILQAQFEIIHDTNADDTQWNAQWDGHDSDGDDDAEWPFA